MLSGIRGVSLAFISLGSCLVGSASSVRGEAEHGFPNAEIRVGIEEGDIRGSDHRALQAAVDTIAAFGGGSVHIGPGRYTMRNALMLRNNVRVVGTGGQTVLIAAPGASSPLAVDGDCNERQITLVDPTGFRVGDGVSIHDDHYGGGFEVTTATLTEQIDSHTFRLSNPLYLDYMVHNKATARRASPVVGGWNIQNASVEGLVIEGNKAEAQPLNGCRGGGIYLFECDRVTIRDCAVRNYPGDGISFQVSRDVVVDSCLAESNASLGIHPGSGSQRPVVRNCRSHDNGDDGLFVCWRVKHGLFERNELARNARAGISIGHKDTDNLFRGNTITSNGRTGVLFRNETEAMGARRNTFEDNTILDNGQESDSASGVTILGSHHDLIFRRNTIGSSAADRPSAAGIATNPGAKNLDAESNTFSNVKATIKHP